MASPIETIPIKRASRFAFEWECHVIRFAEIDLSIRILAVDVGTTMPLGAGGRY